MSNGILIDLFDRGDFHEIMIMFHHSLIHDHPLLANSVADFVLWYVENPEGVGEEEQVKILQIESLDKIKIFSKSINSTVLGEK